jgi:hypothetical protein
MAKKIECCGNCEWHEDFNWVCFCGESEWCADYTAPDNYCQFFKKKSENSMKLLDKS